MITIINLLSISIFGYVLYLKLEDWIKKHNSDQENNSYRVMFFIFVLVLAIDSVVLICYTWSLISIVQLVKVLSWSFFGFSLISLRVNTTLHQRVWNWVWDLFFRKPDEKK